MKVVFDTNVLVAAFTFRGLCYEIFHASRDRYQLITSDYILREFEETLVKRFLIPKDKVASYVAFLKENSLIVFPLDKKIKELRDPNDRLVLTTALAIEADYLIRGDKDLLVFKKVEHTIIISPRDFLLAKLI